MVEMLCKDNGASLDALVKATSRLPHTTRAALTGLRKRGYAVEWVFGESKDSLYRIVEKARGGCRGLTPAMVARLFRRRPISQSTVENLGREVKRIAALNIDQLRALWRETMRRSAPEDLSKDVIARARAYRLKKKSLGGLDPHSRRLLMSLAKSGARRLKNSRRIAMR